MLNYYDLPFTDEERLVQQSTREWVEAEALPGIADHFEAATFPRHLIPQMGKYVQMSGGKRVRPAVLLMAARLCGYNGDRAVLNAAKAAK